MNYDQWEATYKPIDNPVTPNSPYGDKMFETYGEDLQYVKEMAKTNPRNVWTLKEEDEKRFLVNGMKRVDRLGYFVTMNAPTGTDYSIKNMVIHEDTPHITVEVRGGVAYCDDPRVTIIDYDNS